MHYTTEQETRICHLQDLMLEIVALQRYQGEMRLGWGEHDLMRRNYLRIEEMITRLQARRAREYLALREEVPEIDMLLTVADRYDA